MAEKKETFVINLRIDNQAYPITIRYEEEEDYRAAERQINDKLNLYRTRFPGLVKEQYLNMILLDMSVRLVKAERRNDTEPYRAAMENLTAEILSTLGEKQDS
jgi:cell division protein ZapA